MEKECLHLLIRGKQSVVVCPARTIDNCECPETGAVLSKRVGCQYCRPSFLKTVRRPTAECAAKRNELVAYIARQVFITYTAPGSKTEALARETAAAGKPLFTFDRPANKNVVDMGSQGVRPSTLPLDLCVAYDPDDTMG